MALGRLKSNLGPRLAQYPKKSLLPLLDTLLGSLLLLNSYHMVNDGSGQADESESLYFLLFLCFDFFTFFDFFFSTS